MAKLIVKLKQHTPIIHFQSRQKGATLRMTELKSKLDKYIIKMEPKNYPKFIVNEKYNALNYKAKIIETGIPKIWGSKRERISLYFGGLGEDNDVKELLDSKYVILEFFSMNTEMISLIEKYFADFLIQTNFGTRQSKGFGSFYIDPEDDLYKEPVMDYKFSIKTSNLKMLFEEVELFYKSLRSGINDKTPNKEFYCKPAIFFYSKEKGYTWDKKAIKNHFFNEEIEESELKEVIVKDLLGFSSLENWMKYQFAVGENTYPMRIKKQCKRKYNSEKRKGEIEVQRYKSPIFFKIIRDNDYFNVFFSVQEKKENLKIIKDNVYTIIFDDKVKKINKVDPNTIKINQPKNLTFTLNVADICITDFMQYTFDNEKFKLDKAVPEEFRYHNSYMRLKRIYTEIINNKKAGEMK